MRVDTLSSHIYVILNYASSHCNLDLKQHEHFLMKNVIIMFLKMTNHIMWSSCVLNHNRQEKGRMNKLLQLIYFNHKRNTKWIIKMQFPKIFLVPRRKYIYGRKCNDTFGSNFRICILISEILLFFNQLFLTKVTCAVSSSSTKRGQRLSQSHFQFSLLLYRAILNLNTSSSLVIQKSSYLENEE